LELLIDSFERSKNGRGQAVSILAEAGVGKSRLLYEFRKAVANENMTFMEGKCLSYSRGVAYHPIIDIVKSNFDILEGDGELEITEKLKKGLKLLQTDESLTLPYLMELLSIKDSGIDLVSLSPEARKDRIIEAFNRITVRSSQIQPVIMAIEDLHRIDKNSEDVLKSLLESMSGERVFLIFTYRSEYVPTWGAKSYHSQINLNRFSNPENLTMVTNLLGTEEIDGKLEELILEKTEGVPFFIEEFIKSLKDLQIIERKKTKYHLTKDLQNVIIPSTIQDVIMARVDKLPEAAKELLQTGSVIEREFSYDLITHVAGLPEKELLSNLSILISSEILFERGVYPQTVYIFNHALSREVIYESILSMKRRDLHQKIGNAIEELYKKNLYKHYEVLAEHYRKAEDYHKAASYSELAAKKAIKTVSVNDAIVFGYKTINCLEKLPLSEEIERKIIIARNNLGLYCSQLNRFPEAKEVIDPVVDLAIKYDMKKSVARMYNILASYYAFNKGNQIKGSEYFKKAIQLSEKINDFFAFSQANFWLGCALGLNCQFDQASQCFEKALSVSVAANSLWGISVTKSNWACFVFCLKGDPDKAYA
jgi:predicted ATPase